MAGTLTIHSTGGQGLMSGHSWIEYQPDGGVSKTYGTWGNNPRGRGNGLHEDLEQGIPPGVTRSARLDDAQEGALMAKIDAYSAEGADAWGYLSPCSTFAADAWEAGTGESLDHRSGVISNPTRSNESIVAANDAGPVKAPVADTGSSSSPSSSSSSSPGGGPGSPFDSPVQACPVPK